MGGGVVNPASPRLKAKFATKSKAKNAFLLSLLAVAALSGSANALELNIQGQKHWVWTGDDASATDTTNGIKQTKNGNKPTKIEATDGVVNFSKDTNTLNYFLISDGQHIDKITLGGDNSNTLSSFSYNKGFSVGELIVKGGSISHPGRWATTNTCGSTCATLNVDKLTLDASDTANYGTISLSAINAKSTQITGSAASSAITISTTSTANAYNVNLGDITLSNGKLTLGGDTSIYSASSLTLDENASLDTSGATKDLVETKVSKIVIAENAGDGTNGVLTGIDTSKVLSKLSFTAKASGKGDEYDYFATYLSPISVNLGTSELPNTFYQVEHRVIDDGLIKQSGDNVSIYAKNGNDIIANTSMTNYKLAVSDRVQAMFDNAFIARQILLADTLDINSKMMSYKVNKTRLGSNVRGENMYENEFKKGDFWVDYDYTGVKRYGDEEVGRLNLKSHAFALGLGIVDNSTTRAGLFTRYTITNADSVELENSYKANSINAGLYVSQLVWSGGYLRGQLSYHSIGVKGEYVLQNTLAGNTSGSVKHEYSYITTGLGVAQDVDFSGSAWANVGLDFNHIVALSKNEGGDDADDSVRIGADSLSMLSLSGAMGGRVSQNVLIYAHGQAGYVLANYDESFEFDASHTVRGSTLFADNYAYNGFVANIGVGVVWNVLNNLQLSLDTANVAYGNFNDSSFKTKLGLDYRF